MTEPTEPLVCVKCERFVTAETAKICDNCANLLAVAKPTETGEPRRVRRSTSF